jgi:cytoskeletal protein CcmA (bactofilin family)
VQGEIRCEGLVWVGETGKIKGDIVSAYVILEGELEGNIGPSLHVELRSSARMRGNIDTKVLAIADGTSFEGQVNMPTTRPGPSGLRRRGIPAPKRN